MMKKASKIILQTVAGLALAAGGLYLFFSKSDGGQEGMFESLIGELANTSAASVLVCVALAVAATYLRAARWRLMLPAAAPPQHKRGLFSIIAVSQMLNNVLPARLGEAGRVVLLWKRNKFPLATSVGSLALERALDVMAYLLFLFVPVIIMPQILDGLRDIHPIAVAVVWGAAAAFVLIAASFALYILRPQWFKAAALRIIAVLPERFGKRARSAGLEARSCMDWAFSLRSAAVVFLLTAVIALCFAGMVWALIPELRLAGSVFAQAFAAFGSAIPLAPGYVGTLHAVMLQGLAALGIPLSRARAAVVLYHALGYVSQTAMGLILFAAMHARFKDITESAADGGKEA